MNLAILGLDTSHGPAFARIIQQAYPQHRLVAAWPGGSNAIPASRDRVQGFTRELEAMAVPIVDSPETAASNADAVFILTLDGDSHAPLLSNIMRAGQRIYIDKPMAYSPAQAEQMLHDAARMGVQLFSASALRFLPLVQQALRESSHDPITQLHLRAPVNPIDGVPRYHFYVIHAVEVLVTLLGSAIEVVRKDGTRAECFHIHWQSGAKACLELNSEPHSGFDLQIERNSGSRQNFTSIEKSVAPLYGPLLEACLHFFESGKSPINSSETIAILEILKLITDASAQQATE